MRGDRPATSCTLSASGAYTLKHYVNVILLTIVIVLKSKRMECNREKTGGEKKQYFQKVNAHVRSFYRTRFAISGLQRLLIWRKLKEQRNQGTVSHTSAAVFVMIIQLCLLLKENTSCFNCDNIRQMYPLLLLFSTREVKTKSPTLHHRYENGYLTLSSTFVITPRKKKRPTTLVVVGGSHRIEIRRFSMSWVPLYRWVGSPPNSS